MNPPAEGPARVGAAIRPRDGLSRFEDADGFVGYRSPRLAELGVPHVFTTRLGGGPGELDLGDLRAGQLERVRRAAGLADAPLLTVKQVHGSTVLFLGAGEAPPPGAQADGLVSERSDALVGVYVADCVPVLLARADGRRVAAVHAGWRGLVAGVLPRALELLGPGARLAAIGPCLSPARFEVGPEVEDAFTRAGLAAAIRPRPGARACIDLRAAARAQLAGAGVELVDTSERCTYGEPEEFFSYRRDVTHGGRARTGRLAALIAAVR